MPTTRSQDTASSRNTNSPKSAASTKPATAESHSRAKKPVSTKKPPASKKGVPALEEGENPAVVGEKREVSDNVKEEHDEKPPTKKVKTEAQEKQHNETEPKHHPAEGGYQTGTIERGHVYFFYRPKVQLEEAHSFDEVQRLHMLLVPRPPQFAAAENKPTAQANEEDPEMLVIGEGADAVPAAEPMDKIKKHFRLLHIGKKALPDPDAGGGGKGGGRRQVFWATIATVGEDLKKLEEGLGEKTYETKTRGTRYQGAARLVARGAYAIVNKEASTPSKRETHLGYYLSHPSGDQMGEVQEKLGIHQASSFILQVKNPLAPPTGPNQVGLPKSRRAEYPNDILEGIFGKGGQRGRESYGLRFAPCERKELLDYEGAELLFVAARSGEEGLEQSLGEGRGHALEEAEMSEREESMEDVMKELAMDEQKIPAEPLEGTWA